MSHHRFPRSGRLRRGYHCRQVDRFMSQVEVSLSGLQDRLGPEEIRQVGFELVHHGYDVAAVDAALDELEARAVAAVDASGRRARLDPAGELTALREQLGQPYMRRFPRAGYLRRGYNVDDVDDYLDEVRDKLAHGAALDVAEVRRVGFRPKRGGYAEAAVDDTLDRVVGLLLMTQRRDFGIEPPQPDDEPAHEAGSALADPESTPPSPAALGPDQDLATPQA